MTTLSTREKPLDRGRLPSRHRVERPTIATRAEVAPCTCPEHCERDHEHD